MARNDLANVFGRHSGERCQTKLGADRRLDGLEKTRSRPQIWSRSGISPFSDKYRLPDEPQRRARIREAAPG